MKKNLIIILSTWLLLSHPSLIGQSNDWLTLQDENYTIQYPGNWELDTSGSMGLSFVIRSPLNSGNDRIQDNVSLVVQELTADTIGLDQFLNSIENDIRTISPKPEIISSKRSAAQPADFHELIFSSDYELVSLKSVQRYWVFEGSSYVLTLTCEKGEYHLHKDIGTKILNSFTLKD